MYYTAFDVYRTLVRDNTHTLAAPPLIKPPISSTTRLSQYDVYFCELEGWGEGEEEEEWRSTLDP